MSYQQSSNEGPYPQQQPPVMSPRPAGSIDFMGIVKSQDARPLVIAGVGAILTLIAYLFFPVWGESVSGVDSALLGSSGSVSITASDIGKYASGFYGLSWLVLLASIVAVVVVGLALFAPRAVAQLTPRLSAMILTGCGAVCVLWTVVDFFKLNSLKQGGSFGTVKVSAGPSWGIYLLVITSIVLLVGAVMQLRRTPAN